MSAAAEIVVGGCRILPGDCRQRLADLPDESVDACVTSPPYWRLRDYGVDGQIGLEESVFDYVGELVGVFREVRRVLKPAGTLWLNLGDCYAGSWSAQSRGGPPSEKSTLLGNGHVGGGPKLKSLSAVQIDAHQKGRSGTGSLSRTPGLKDKDLIGMPWRVAFALQADGYYLREDIVWHKRSCMPESVRDRCTRSHEFVFHFAKSPAYYHDAAAIAESAVSDHTSGNGFKRPARLSYGGGADDRASDAEWTGVGGTRNARSVWTLGPEAFADAHFAVMPTALAARCIQAGCPVGGIVLDPFAGAATTLLVADRLQRRSVGIELNPAYVEMAARRLRNDAPLFAEAVA